MASKKQRRWKVGDKVWMPRQGSPMAGVVVAIGNGWVDVKARMNSHRRYVCAPDVLSHRALVKS